LGVPFVQKYSLIRYIMRQRWTGRDRYPLVLMLEPLFRCNLACMGCGKIAYPEEILNRRLSIDDCLCAVDECGAPVVSITGGEPLIHQDLQRIAAGITGRRKFVYLCTNGLLLKSKLQEYRPSPYLTFSVHLDGPREQHDALAGRPGVFDSAVEAITAARRRGFRVTVNCTVYNGSSPDKQADFFDFVTALGVEGITLSAAYHYERARREDLFLKRRDTHQFFRDLFRLGKGRRWPFNHSTLFLDFLAGRQNYHCTPWGNPTRNVFGWQRPCYLRVGEGCASTFRALMDETDWSGCGPERDPKCADCMLHCGYEPTAVQDAVAHPLKALRVWMRSSMS
jgi:hopanoid biosynthesis associated radical SAM protein HpnH